MFRNRGFNWLVLIALLSACTENYANGERIGLITQFSRAGVVWKSWEGHLNLTQTGMNSSSTVPFDFSVDNDAEDQQVLAAIDSAAKLGWKVRLVYHETFGLNWFHNRGETKHFITTVEVLDRNPMGFLHNAQPKAVADNGHTIDTIYVVVVGKASDHQ